MVPGYNLRALNPGSLWEVTFNASPQKTRAYGIGCSGVRFATRALGLPSETMTSTKPASQGSLTIGHVLAGMGAESDPADRLEDVHIIRHSFQPGNPNALRGPEDLGQQRVLSYTREQDISPRRFPARPPRYWVILIADGQRRSRLWGTLENHGEIAAERTETHRFFRSATRIVSCTPQ